MSKDEFMRGLSEALSGELPPETVRENLRYYEGYIQNEILAGRAESEIMDELGDPRLIARTILDTTPGAGDGAWDGYRPAADAYAEEDGQDIPRRKVHVYTFNQWYWRILGPVLAVLVVFLIITVVTGILSILIPLLPALVLIMVIIWFLQGGPHRW